LPAEGQGPWHSLEFRGFQAFRVAGESMILMRELAVMPEKYVE
jgi:hypothetical protein